MTYDSPPVCESAYVLRVEQGETLATPLHQWIPDRIFVEVTKDLRGPMILVLKLCEGRAYLEIR